MQLSLLPDTIRVIRYAVLPHYTALLISPEACKTTLRRLAPPGIYLGTTSQPTACSLFFYGGKAGLRSFPELADRDG